jgi:hypothetical protein
MKHNQVIAGILFALLMVVIVACGGGGGPTTGGTFTSIRMEAIINGTSTSIDPTNIFTNEQIQFRLTGVDENSLRVVIPTSGYSLTGTPGGTLDSNGLFSAGSSPTGFTGTVKVTFDSVQYTTAAKVVVPDAVIAGLGRTTSGAPAKGVQIWALNSSGTVVGTGTVATTGAIRFSVPPTAVRFTTSFAAIDPGPNFFYVRQFAYGGLDYSTTIAGCTAPLPTLTSGVTSVLSTNVVFYAISSGTPPPPPDGCQ